MTKNVSDEQAFWFSTEEGSAGFVAHDTLELRDAFRKVPMKSIKFHLREDKNDFEAWLRNVMEDHAVADSVVKIKEDFSKGSLKGVALRKTLVKTLKK
ncbi:MAG: hypothetical protein JW700_02515 [Candidatus Aenigmarchaeota archaeon]|nr:hypothetical protein [Candidatus Aenigmarchaeota archaeon]